MAKRWTETDLRFLRDNFERMDVQLLAERLGARLDEVEARIEKLGLKRTEAGTTKTLATYREMSRHSEAARREYDKGFALLQKKKFGEAEKHFRTLLAEFGDERELVDRAKMYLAVCERKSRAAQANAGDGSDDAYYAALFEKNRENFVAAIEQLKKSSRKSGDGRSPFLLACCYARLGDNDRALEALEQAIAEDEAHRLQARRDSDLESLRALSRFNELTAATA
jgi:tetratricopeptide (TPR) repeat protein